MRWFWFVLLLGLACSAPIDPIQHPQQINYSSMKGEPGGFLRGEWQEEHSQSYNTRSGLYHGWGQNQVDELYSH